MCRAGHTTGLDHLANDVAQRLLGEEFIDVTYLFGDGFVGDYTTYGSFVHLADGISFLIDVVHNHFHQCVNIYFLLVVGDDGFFFAIESHSFTLCSRTYFCNVI
ncbi:hypothetical protein SDC9_179177 [bioreactor metagenome]|uniref:Uncharacterized protein n=1 Tax=bioreactor metagenome TaxID=1076179 RepID=A0A645H7B2_9ZZZZ